MLDLFQRSNNINPYCLSKGFLLLSCSLMGKYNEDGLVSLVKKLENYIDRKDVRKATVSKSDVAWQIDHSLKVINLVSESLFKSDPNSYQSGFKIWRFILFNLNYIPRGRAKSPKIVRPPDNITTDTLTNQVSDAFENIERLTTADEKAHFTHFVFGVLNRKRTIRFLHLHTNHHLKIIRDIIK